jgi:ABC-type transport system involved in multi-copper enzyme maturation permease subunit
MTGFAHLLRAEWTKLRTVRGWALALPAAVLVTVLIGLVTASGAKAGGGCGGGAPHCGPPTGPGGGPVSDSFTFVHRPLEGDGTVTARVTALTGQVPPRLPGGPAATGAVLDPWAKTGLIVKAGMAPGSAYAAVMRTGAHGVRMQADFTHDVTRNLPRDTDAPVWLRLTRATDTLTGYASPDGAHWTRIGAVRLPGLPHRVQAGLFTASPDAMEVDRHFLGESATGGPTRASGAFDHVTVAGAAPAGWQGTRVGADPTAAPPGSPAYEERGGRFTVDGSGDIAPAVGGRAFGAGRSVEGSLVGTFAGLVVLIVLATSFVTAEYRRGLIRTTFAAEPRRGRVLAAKAIVTAAAASAVGVVAATSAVAIGDHLLRAKGVYVQPVGAAAELRIIVGTALLLAAAAVLALAVGTAVRRAAGAVTVVTAAIVLPYVLAVSSAVPEVPAEWLLRVTPAAAFAIQQTLVRYPQVGNLYTPANGYYPLSPWEGLAVLCGYAAFALAAAWVLLRRRDA